MKRPLFDRVHDHLWEIRTADLPPGLRQIARSTRLLVVVVRDAQQTHINLRAMSLVYTTLLSMVPLLALSFSVLKGFGVHNQIRPMLMRLLTPLGPRADEITANIIGFVDNVKVGVLGSVGLLLLVYTVYSLLQKIEGSLNAVWHIRRKRSMVERFSNYLSVTLVGPLLIFAAIGLTGAITGFSAVRTLSEIEPFGTLMVWLGQLMPYVLVIGAFTFIYVFVPNTRVQLRFALPAGTAAGIAWQSMGWLFAALLSGSTRYTAIYSGFAALFIFMFWLYLSWMILLMGAKIAFYLQHPQFVTRNPLRLHAGNRQREAMALEVMYRVGDAYLRQAPAWTFDQLTKELHVPGETLSIVTDRLEHHGLLITTDGDEPGYVPGRDLSSLTISSILDAVRAPDPGEDFPEEEMQLLEPVRAIAERVEAGIRESADGRSLRDLITETASDDK